MFPHLKGACWRFPLGCYFYFANSERHPAWDERQSPLGGGRPPTRYSIRSSSVLTALIGPKVEVSYALPPSRCRRFCLHAAALPTAPLRRESLGSKYLMSFILHTLSLGKKLYIFLRVQGTKVPRGFELGSLGPQAKVPPTTLQRHTSS